MGSDFLMVTDLEPQGLAEVLDLAAAVKARPGAVRGRLTGTAVGLFFEKPSTRTRVSCEVAATELGAHAVVLKQDEVGLGAREPAEDVARVLERYLQVLAFRVFDHGQLDRLAEYASIPVINLLSDRTHPCQVLADLQTIAEHRPLSGTTLAYVGDGNNVCHSLMLGGAMSGMHVRVATPPGHEPDAGIAGDAAGYAASSGGAVTVGDDPEVAVKEADVVYTDVWASMGQEAERETRSQLFTAYQVDEDLFALAAPEAIFLHCLPAHRGEEVSPGVMEHPRSFVFDQAENRLHSFKALLLHLTAAM